MNIFNLTSPSRRKTIKILTIGNYSVMVIDIIQGIAFVPLYLFFIGDRLYGLWLGTGGILAALSFLDMGMATLTAQRVSREYGLKNYLGVSKYFFGGLLLNIVFLSLLFLAGMVLSFWLGVFLPDVSITEKIILKRAFQIALLALVLSLINSTIENTINALQKPLIGKISILTGAIVGIIVVYLLLLRSQPLLAIPIGLLVRSVVAIIPNVLYLGFLFLKNNIALFNFNKEAIKDYLRLTPNLMLSKIGTSLVSNIEPTLINMFISPEVAVCFSITKKAGGLIRTVLDRIGGIIYTSMAHIYVEQIKDRFNFYFVSLINYLIPFTVSLTLTYFLLNKSFVTLWVGNENYLGDIFTLLICISVFFNFTSNYLSYMLSTTGDIRYTSNAVFLESCTKIVLFIIMIKVYGILGLLIAIIFTSMLFTFIYLKRWNKHLLLPRLEVINLIKLNVKSIVPLIIVTLFVYLIFSFLSISTMSLFAIQAAIAIVIMSVTLIISNSMYKNLFIKLINRINFK